MSSLEHIYYSVLTFRLITPYEQALLCGFLMETAWWLSVRYLTADLKAIVLVLSMTTKDLERQVSGRRDCKLEAVVRI